MPKTSTGEKVDGFKWRVNYALRSAGLPGPSIGIMFALSDRANVGTGVVPAIRTPSLVELAAVTGYSEATVKRHLNTLEAAGWVERTRPTAREKAAHLPTTYKIMIPSGPAPTPAAEGSQRTPDRATRGLTQSPREGSQKAPAGAQGEPSYKDNNQTIKHTPVPAPREPSHLERADVLRVCTHLADRIAQDGSRHPTVTDAWIAAAVALLDADQIPETQIHTMIDWSQDHIAFWRTRVTSMPALHRSFDTMRKQRTAALAADPPTPIPPPITALADVDQGPAAEPETKTSFVRQARDVIRATMPPPNWHRKPAAPKNPTFATA